MKDKELNEWIEVFKNTASSGGNIVAIVYEYTEQLEREHLKEIKKLKAHRCECKQPVKCCDNYIPDSTKHSDLYIDTNDGHYVDIYIEYCKSCGNVSKAYE